MKYINIIDFNGYEAECLIEMIKRKQAIEQEDREKKLSKLKKDKSKFFGSQPSVPKRRQ